MDSLVTLTGVDACTQRLQAIQLEVLPLLAIALQQEADAILEQSQPLVPIETGELKASGQVEDPVITGTRATTGVRYGGVGTGLRRPEEYAIYVHERTDLHHPVGQHHFLTQPAFAATAGMLARLADALRLAL